MTLRETLGGDAGRVYRQLDDWPNRLAAERTVDQILADSFPASDPPSWTPGIARPARARHVGGCWRNYLLVLLAVLLVGLPVALAVRGEAVGWLFTLFFS